MSKKIQAKYILAIGSMAALMGSVYLTLIFNSHTIIMDMIPGIFLLGVDYGYCIPTYS